MKIGATTAALALLLAIQGLTASVAPAAAQDLPIRTALPSGEALLCRPNVGPTVGPTGADRAGDPAAAERLIQAATQAMLLGDLDGALDFLDRAVSADSMAAEAAYLQARIHERKEDPDAAAHALCRYLRMAPRGDAADDARQRLDVARDQGVGEPLLAAYRRALALEQEGMLQEADDAFTQVVEASPGATVALYNRAVVRLGLGRTEDARADLQRYLELDPEAPDAHPVRQFLGGGVLAAAPASPRTVFLAGALVPGGGQFYTQRPRLGAVVLGTAATAVTAGLLYERTTIQCLEVTTGRCPEEAVASQETERPLLGPALGLAAAVAVGAAIEALLHVRGSDPDRGSAAGDRSHGSWVLGSGAIAYTPSGLRLELVRLSF